MLAKCSVKGEITLTFAENTYQRFKQHKGLQEINKNLQAYVFNIKEPRKAKCCQSWLDPLEDDFEEGHPFNVYSNGNPCFRFNIEKLKTVRNLHSIVNNLKILKCIICHRQTPGLDILGPELKVLEDGERQLLNDYNVIKALSTSQVLRSSVQLDPVLSKGNEWMSK